MVNRPSIDDSIIHEYDPFDEKRKKQQQRKRRKIQRIHVTVARITAIVLTICAVTGVYFMTEGSKVRSIRVKGNTFFKDEEIMELAKVDYSSRFYLCWSFMLEQRLKANPLIDGVTVRHDTNRTLTITVEEKPCIGYFWEEDEPKILCKDGTVLNMSSRYYSGLSLLPMLDSSLDRKLLVEAFQNVTSLTIANISEVFPYVTTYDKNMFRVLMDDGNQVFVTVQTAVDLNYYLEIQPQLFQQTGACIVFYTITEDGHTRDCAELDKEEQEALHPAVDEPGEEPNPENK